MLIYFWGFDEDDYVLIGYKVYDSFFMDNVFFMEEYLVLLYVGLGLYLVQESDVGLLVRHIYVCFFIIDFGKYGVV